MSVAQIADGRPVAVGRRLARRDPFVVASVVVLAVVALLALIGPVIAPYPPDELYTGPVLSAPSLAHPLGTDDLGRDILSRLLVGTPSSVVGPVIVVTLSTLIGVTLAVVAAWYRGAVDAVAGRLIELIFAIPGLVLAVLAVAMFGKGLIAPVLALSIAYVPIVARLVRTAVVIELGKPYVEALRVQGLAGRAICFRHVLPAVFPAILAQATVGFGYAMLDLAAISYLGLGVQPPAPDWGVMIADGQQSILVGAIEQSFFPAVMIVLTVLAVNVVGARLTTRAEGGDR